MLFLNKFFGTYTFTVKFIPLRFVSPFVRPTLYNCRRVERLSSLCSTDFVVRLRGACLGSRVAVACDLGRGSTSSHTSGTPETDPSLVQVCGWISSRSERFRTDVGCPGASRGDASGEVRPSVAHDAPCRYCGLVRTTTGSERGPRSYPTWGRVLSTPS